MRSERSTFPTRSGTSHIWAGRPISARLDRVSTVLSNRTSSTSEAEPSTPAQSSFLIVRPRRSNSHAQRPAALVSKWLPLVGPELQTTPFLQLAQVTPPH